MDALARPGDKIGRYVIESPLGTGGMGQVFRAFDEVLRRRVALKLLHTAQLAHESAEDAERAVERIRREARMAASLEHPNVVAIYDVGEHNGVAFIVMEHVLGRSLRAMIGADIPVATRERWATDVARALGAAHRAGLVHRDIKPENVMVRNDGTVKVLDFGIARRATDALERRASLPPAAALDELPDELRATLAGTREDAALVGTPGYMPPELLIHHHSDARSDEFAWGVMAYELLAGKLPWTRGEDAASLCAATLFDAPPPLASACPDASPAFVAAVERALMKKPGDRFESIDALLAALGTTSTAASSLAPPPSSPSMEALALAETAASGPNIDAIRASAGAAAAGTLGTAPPAVSLRPRAARSSASTFGFAAFGFFLAAGGGYALFRSHRSVPTGRTVVTDAIPPLVVTNVQRLTYEEGCEEYPSFLPDGHTVLYDGEDGADYHLFALDRNEGARRAVTHEPGWQYAAAISPDGRRVAYLWRDSERIGTYVRDIDGTSPPRHIADGPVRPAWSVDGRAIWCGANTNVTLYDAETAEPIRSLHPPSAIRMLNVLELPDRRLLARASEPRTSVDTALLLFTADGTRSSVLFSYPLDEVLTLAPDGLRVLVARQVVTTRNELWQVPLDGSAPSAVPTLGALASKGLHFTPDGQHLVLSDCGQRGVVGVLEHGADGGLTVRDLGPSREWLDRGVAAIPGSNHIVVVSNRGGRPQPWIIDPSLREASHEFPVEGEAIETAVSPDSRVLALSIDGVGIEVAPLDRSSAPRVITHGRDHRPAFSRDGARVYFERTLPDGARRVMVVPAAGGGAVPFFDTNAWAPSTSTAADVLGYLTTPSDATQATPWLRDLVSGRDRLLSPELNPGTYGPIVFAPDGRRALVSDSARQLIEVDLASGRIVGRYNAGGQQVVSVAYLGDAAYVFRSDWSGDLWTADVHTR